MRLKQKQNLVLTEPLNFAQGLLQGVGSYSSVDLEGGTEHAVELANRKSLCFGGQKSNLSLARSDLLQRNQPRKNKTSNPPSPKNWQDCAHKSGPNDALLFIDLNIWSKRPMRTQGQSRRGGRRRNLTLSFKHNPSAKTRSRKRKIRATPSSSSYTNATSDQDPDSQVQRTQSNTEQRRPPKSKPEEQKPKSSQIPEEWGRQRTEEVVLTVTDLLLHRRSTPANLSEAGRQM